MRTWWLGIGASLIAGGALAADPPMLAQMNSPHAPFKLTDEIYYVGTKDVTAFAIDTGAGLIVTDGGFEQTAPQIIANLKTLGFDIKNVKILLNSHGHVDHAGGLAPLKAASGATFYAARGDAAVLESGGAADFALGGGKLQFPAIKPDIVFDDGAKIKLGKVELTEHVTAGHTRGCSSWTMTAHIGGKPANVLFICSLTVLPMYSLVTKPSYPGIADDFKKSIATLRAQPCEVFLSSHARFFTLEDKYKKVQAGTKDAFIDPAGCKAFIDGAEKNVNAKIAKERATK